MNDSLLARDRTRVIEIVLEMDGLEARMQTLRAERTTLLDGLRATCFHDVFVEVAIPRPQPNSKDYSGCHRVCLHCGLFEAGMGYDNPQLEGGEVVSTKFFTFHRISGKTPVACLPENDLLRLRERLNEQGRFNEFDLLKPKNAA